jgi:hypothetical protein
LLTGEPGVVVACLARLAVSAVVAGLPGDIGTGQKASLEAVLGGLFLIVRGRISGVEELVDDGLVLANAVTEHAAVVTVGIETPDYVKRVAGSVGRHDLSAPVCSGCVIVNTNTSIVSTYATSADWRGVQVRPRFNRLEDGTFRASISTGLKTISVKCLAGDHGLSYLVVQADSTLGFPQVTMAVDQSHKSESSERLHCSHVAHMNKVLRRATRPDNIVEQCLAKTNPGVGAEKGFFVSEAVDDTPTR